MINVKDEERVTELLHDISSYSEAKVMALILKIRTELKEDRVRDLDQEGRLIIMRLKHDPGSPKGKAWCDGYHEGLSDMLVGLKKLYGDSD